MIKLFKLNLHLLIIVSNCILILYSQDTKADFPQTRSPYWQFRGDYLTQTADGIFLSPESACLAARANTIQTSGCNQTVTCGAPFVGVEYTYNMNSTSYVGAHCVWNTYVQPNDLRFHVVQQYMQCPRNALKIGRPSNISSGSIEWCRCESGYSEDGLGGCTANLVISPKNDGPSQLCTKHPINIGTGNKYLQEPLLDSTGVLPLAVAFTYNSPHQQNLSQAWVGRLGVNWIGSWEQKIKVYVSNQAEMPTVVGLRQSNGRELPFHSVNASSVFVSDSDVNDQLQMLLDTTDKLFGWTRVDQENDVIEHFDVNGNLLTRVAKSLIVQKFTYSDGNGGKYPADAPNCRFPLGVVSTELQFKGVLNCVTDSAGRQLNFQYDNAPRVIKVISQSGSAIQFSYDANNNLTSVTYPDGKVKTYHYGEASHVSSSPVAGVSNVSLLTGITDENGIRYATYNYDNKGRAISEFLAGNADAASLVYNVDGSGNPTSTQVTDSRGSVRTYNFTTILGVVKSTGQSQPAGSGCAASAAAMTYDVNGNVSSRTDFNGNKTTYVYDMDRNLETSRTEGLTSAGATTTATRTITTTWHTTWRLPLVTSEYTGATATGTALRTTTNVYDSKGNITSTTEADPVRGLSRTTTITYTYSTAVPGLTLSKVVDGPRTDVNDITTYHYYPHDATCTASTATPITDPITGLSPANLGCRGQLMSVTNALNQTTTYDRYNHHGQVEQMTDANGLVTSNTYDLRQRLLTRTVGTETTTLTYDGVGQVTQLTLPDNSQLNYTYDAAHRLTDVQDSLGNKVHYTLDTEGNRTNEITTDPSNQLTKTLSRSYDALNRLQQVVGVE